MSAYGIGQYGGGTYAVPAAVEPPGAAPTYGSGSYGSGNYADLTAWLASFTPPDASRVAVLRLETRLARAGWEPRVVAVPIEQRIATP